MLYLERIPAPPLARFVRSLWHCENLRLTHNFERVLPSGAAQLIVNLKEDRTRTYLPEKNFACETTSGTVLSGAQMRYCVIDTAETECVVGAVFCPGGTAPFFHLPAHEISDRSISLDLLWGRRASDLREQLLAAPSPHARLETLERLLTLAFQPLSPDAAVDFALQVFHHRPDRNSVAAVTDRTGLSARRFIQRFKSSVGLSPKQYCRILRFQSALTCARTADVDWTRIALDCGYFDQAHFIHDFRDFSGITPTGYRRGRTEFQNHVKFLQSPAAAL